MAENKPVFAYWPIRGANRGNVNRYCFAWGGVDFEDKRYNREQWAEDKANLGMDFPNIPYVKNGDFYITESKCVTPYICDKFAPDLIGDNPEERARILQIQEQLVETGGKWFPQVFSSDERSKIADDGVANFKKFSDFLGEKQFLTGDKFTFVDFILWEQIETVNMLAQDTRIFTAYPNFEAFHNRVKSLPKFAAYLASDKHIAGPCLPPGLAKIDF